MVKVRLQHCHLAVGRFKHNKHICMKRILKKKYSMKIQERLKNKILNVMYFVGLAYFNLLCC